MAENPLTLRRGLIPVAVLLWLKALGARFVLVDPDTKAPVKGISWKRHSPSIRSLIEWNLQGGLIGVIPASIGCIVLDADAIIGSLVRGVLNSDLLALIMWFKPLAVLQSPNGRHLYYTSASAKMCHDLWRRSSRKRKPDCEHRNNGAKIAIAGVLYDLRGCNGYVVLYDGMKAAELCEAVQQGRRSPLPGLVNSTRGSTPYGNQDRKPYGTNDPSVLQMKPPRGGEGGERRLQLTAEWLRRCDRGMRHFAAFAGAESSSYDGVEAERIRDSLLAAVETRAAELDIPFEKENTLDSVEAGIRAGRIAKIDEYGAPMAHHLVQEVALLVIPVEPRPNRPSEPRFSHRPARAPPFAAGFSIRGREPPADGRIAAHG